MKDLFKAAPYVRMHKDRVVVVKDGMVISDTRHARIDARALAAAPPKPEVTR